jgi:ubiquinone/menaquinone biosynthesis C-methylase UbiE
MNPLPPVEAQALSVKRAQVEFHNFASLGEPERAISAYEAENVRRGGLIRKHRDFIGDLSPFLEIGANAGHSSYMLANEFGADGFALDISADALRHGIALQQRWNYARAPLRVAGDALHLPFQDGSLKLVMAYQVLSQFMSIESVFLEVKRVLAPGGVFLFAEEPLRRTLTLGLYRCPYPRSMKPWERKLFDWGLLGYLVRDVIGADQEESFGIRQNHTMDLKAWHGLIGKHFAEHRYDIFVPERGWPEAVMKRAAVRLDPYRSVWRSARLLGGTLAAVCKKSGAGQASRPVRFEPFEAFLVCPDCGNPLRRTPENALLCAACAYQAPLEAGVYNLLPSPEKAELYPGDRDDIIDFSVPGHERHLIGDWYELEGIFGNKFRWIGARAEARLARVRSGPQRIRIRGYAVEEHLPAHLIARINGREAGQWVHDRPGLFVVEADVPDAPEYHVEFCASPAWRDPASNRTLTVNLSMIRLVPKD